MGGVNANKIYFKLSINYVEVTKRSEIYSSVDNVTLTCCLWLALKVTELFWDTKKYY